MATILDKIVSETHPLVSTRKRDRPVSSLESMPLFADERRNFRDALRGRPLSVIAECKQASPSKGVFTEHYDPARRAAAYQAGGASAISVVTEPHFFRGAPEHLEIARRAAELPILRKDFIIDPYQILEARAFGADAVLLIATILDRDQIAELWSAADENGLHVLVELYAPDERDKIDLDTVQIVGVNSRNLRTFEVQLDSAVAALGSLPANIVRVAESGISSPDTLVDLQARGIDAALIGETFMRMTEPRSLVESYTSAVAGVDPHDGPEPG